ncbi:MAG TPA: hypothetical protein VFF62_04945 [Candidatus Nitrosocosmicus sp.]|jgi:hypothetical protein|nr:hypothetical protein [Candidatus Nitrosocosmicus sp.]
MRRLIALTVALALALPMVIVFAPAPARADNDTATNVALGLAAFAVFNQLVGPRPVQVDYRPEPVYRRDGYYDGPVYRDSYGYGRHGYRRVVPYPHGRYEFRGDGYYGQWVWIPYGRYPAPPVPHFPHFPRPPHLPFPPFHR